MALQPATYIDQTGDAPTSSVVITGRTNDKYQTVEQRDGSWHGPFEMSEEELEQAVESDTLDVRGSLPSDQFLKVCQAAGVDRNA